MFLSILVLTTALLCGGVRSQGRPPPPGRPGPDGSGPGGPGPGGQGSPPPATGDGGANLSWLGIVFGTVAGAVLVIALVALALFLWLCCCRRRWRDRDAPARPPPVVIIQKDFENPPVFVVPNETKEKEQDLAPPSYRSAVSKPPFSPPGYKFDGANSPLYPKPSNRSSATASTSSAPPVSVRHPAN